MYNTLVCVDTIFLPRLEYAKPSSSDDHRKHHIMNYLDEKMEEIVIGTLRSEMVVMPSSQYITSPFEVDDFLRID